MGDLKGESGGRPEQSCYCMCGSGLHESECLLGAAVILQHVIAEWGRCIVRCGVVQFCAVQCGFICVPAILCSVLGA